MLLQATLGRGSKDALQIFSMGGCAGHHHSRGQDRKEMDGYGPDSLTVSFLPAGDRFDASAKRKDVAQQVYKEMKQRLSSTRHAAAPTLQAYQAQSSEVTDSLGNAFNRAATLKQMFDNWDGELPADLQKVYRNLSSAMNQIAEAKQTAYNVEMKLRRYR